MSVVRRFFVLLVVLAALLVQPTVSAPAVRDAGAVGALTRTSASIGPLRCGHGRLVSVVRGGVAWRAVGCGSVNASGYMYRASVEIYRRVGGSWEARATVRIPEGGPWNYLGAFSVTHGEAPDFIASAGGGADWLPLVVIARLDGRWQLVPFDAPAQSGSQLVVQAFHFRPRFGLIQSDVDACGCAGGPVTFIWYRFDRWHFVPAQPPGAAAECAASTLDRARVLPGDPAYEGPPRWRFAPFQAVRFACLDGWALAANGVGQVALFNQLHGQWYRVWTGPSAILLQDAAFALPQDLLTLLRHRVLPAR